MIKVGETQLNELGVLLENYKKLEQENARLLRLVERAKPLIELFKGYTTHSEYRQYISNEWLKDAEKN